AGLVCSEMVSCAGLHHGNERTLGYLRIASDEHPLAVQIFGSEPAVMAEAARMVEQAGADIVDINFGCPVRKVTKTGAGATLLEDPIRAEAIVAAVAAAVSVPVTVKMRRGLEDGSRACLDVGPRLVAAGAQALTLHPRSARQFKQALLVLDDVNEIERRLLAAAPGAADLVAALEAEYAVSEDVLLELPISIYGGG